MNRDAGVEIPLGSNLAPRRGVVTKSWFIQTGCHEISKSYTALLRNSLSEYVFEVAIVAHIFLIRCSDKEGHL
jgi:hypothetical protein